MLFCSPSKQCLCQNPLQFTLSKLLPSLANWWVWIVLLQNRAGSCHKNLSSQDMLSFHLWWWIPLLYMILMLKRLVSSYQHHSYHLFWRWGTLMLASNPLVIPHLAKFAENYTQRLRNSVCTIPQDCRMDVVRPLCIVFFQCQQFTSHYMFIYIYFHSINSMLLFFSTFHLYWYW